MGTTALLSFEEFERLPGEPGKDELLEGELFHLPPAVRNHMIYVRRVFFLLTEVFGKAGADADRVFMETGYRLGARSWVVPDVSITHQNQPYGKYLEGAPAVAVEVMSEFNTARQIDRKRKLYLAHGALEVWVLYPDSESAWVYREGRAEEFTGELRSDVLPNLRIGLKELFAST